MTNNDLRFKALLDINKERDRQNAKYGVQRHSYETWLTILVEEVGELAQAIQKNKGWGKETDADNLPEEITHVAAVATAILEQVYEEMNLKEE